MLFYAKKKASSISCHIHKYQAAALKLLQILLLLLINENFLYALLFFLTNLHMSKAVHSYNVQTIMYIHYEAFKLFPSSIFKQYIMQIFKAQHDINIFLLITYKINFAF